LGHQLLILPLGLIPLYFLGAYLFSIFIRNSVEVNYGRKKGKGITEYPSEVSVLLEGTNENSISFTEDGRSVVVTTNSKYEWISDATSLKEYIEDIMRRRSAHDDIEFVDFLIIEAITRDGESGNLRLTISIPDEVMRSKKYIEHEISNLGRVFVRNSSNDVRWLIHPQGGERRVTEKDGKILVYINRVQLVPGFFHEKTIFMSERQITRNIKNRLWNRLDVKCISIDDHTYCGEILCR